MARILYAEDDIAIADALSVLLIEVFNHTVTHAQNGHEALSLWNEYPNGFDLLLTDGNMPILSGRELVTAIRSKAPHFPIIGNSGTLNYWPENITSNPFFRAHAKLDAIDQLDFYIEELVALSNRQ